jgi:hypothetical protein
MKVSLIKNLIENKKSDCEMAVIWFDKTDGEAVAEDDLSPAEWQKIVRQFTSNKYLNQIADELMRDLVDDIIEAREKAGK